MKIESFINLVAVAVISAYLGGKAQEKKHIQILTELESDIWKRPKNETPSYRRYLDYYADRRPSRCISEIVVDSRKEGEEVLVNLDRLAHDYGQVSVSDFYDLVGVQTQFSDNKIGWKELSHAGLKKAKCGYTFVLPKPVNLD